MLHSLLVTVALCSTTGTIMGFHESSQTCMHHLKFIPCPADPDVRIDRLVPPWLGSPWYSIPVERYSITVSLEIHLFRILSDRGE